MTNSKLKTRFLEEESFFKNYDAENLELYRSIVEKNSTNASDKKERDQRVFLMWITKDINKQAENDAIFGDKILKFLKAFNVIGVMDFKPVMFTINSESGDAFHQYYFSASVDEKDFEKLSALQSFGIGYLDPNLKHFRIG